MITPPALRPVVAASLLLAALGCSAGSSTPAATAAPVAASAPRAAAPPSAAAPAPPVPPAPQPGAPATSQAAAPTTPEIGVLGPAAGGPEPSPGDTWEPKDFGDRLAVVDMTLVRGLEAVDIQPKTLPSPLSPAPPDGLDTTGLPAANWLFGAMPVTRTESIPLAVSEDRQWLVLDSDRDGRLTAAERVARTDAWGGLAWFSGQAPVRVKNPDGIVQMIMPFRIGVSLQAPRVASRPDAHREGTLTVGDRKVRVAILDQTFRCWFSHPRLDVLVVDTDGDGAFDTTPDSFERYRLGEPFPVGDIDAVVTAVGPLGSSITVNRSTKPALRKASLRMGSAAPVFKATTVDGKAVDLAALRGKWVLLDFWATWCGPCRGELPNLKALRKQHPDVVILGISGDDAAEAVKQFVAREGMDWPQVHADARPIMRQYRVNSFPTSFLVGPDGKLAARDLRGPGLVMQIGELKASRAR